ncbi:MAG: hypothetical protein KGD68_12115 [Candidatus Lokiarchaeota archaeon]|nr:hypothetical protein [Candidatus Lokiarchaeota archaeon]
MRYVFVLRNDELRSEMEGLYFGGSVFRIIFFLFCCCFFYKLASVMKFRIEFCIFTSKNRMQLDKKEELKAFLARTLIIN